MTFTGYHTVPHQPPGQLNAGARLTFKLSEEIKQLAQEGRRRSHHNSKEIAGRKHRIEANGSNNVKQVYLPKVAGSIKFKHLVGLQMLIS